jgi:PAS domain S-box-containing protein
VVDSDRKYVGVSDSFCQLAGYQCEELVGMRYDDLTAPNTNDVPTVFGLFQKLGYMHGMWMPVSREGTRILVRYESWLRPDSYTEGHMEVVGAGYREKCTPRHGKTLLGLVEQETIALGLRAVDLWSEKT